MSPLFKQLADRWIAEARDGIDGTGIRPGFIKIGVDGAPLPEVNRKLVLAAALTHTTIGLKIHQPPAPAPPRWKRWTS